MKTTARCLAAALATLCVLGWNIKAQAGDVTVLLPGSSDFIVMDDAAKYLFKVDAANGYVGIGTSSPTRHLHVVGDDNIAKFKTDAADSRALLDLEAPNATSGKLSRLCWRSSNSASESKQFGALDLIYLNKNKGAESSVMRFLTMRDGELVEGIRIEEGNRVGIGTNDPMYNLDVARNANYNFAARFRNTNTGGGAGVLKLGVNSETPGAGNEFIKFESYYGDSGTEIGSVVGNGSGGVTYRSTGGDFAEYMPLRQQSEPVEAGDIVGLFAGTVSKTTLGTDRVRVISSAPAVLGNAPPRDQIDRFRKVAFVGQVPVKVRGAVHAGDYIVPSGLNDGLGIAVPPEKLSPARYGQIVGVALEPSTEASAGKVVVEVGLHTAAKQLADLHAQKDRQISDLTQAIQSLQARLEALEKAFSRMNPEPNLASLFMK